MSRARADSQEAHIGQRIAGELYSDLRYGLRGLISSPGFSLASTLIMATAIGANTLLFTFFNAYLLKPLPVKDPQRNVEITAMQASGRRVDSWSYTDFSQFRAQNQAFAETYAWTSLDFSVREPSPRKVKAILVSSNLLRIFNARMILGRSFAAEEGEVPGRDAVAVLSHNAWQRIFSADPQIAGKAIRIRKTAFTIIGVTDPEFTGTDPVFTPDMWVPVAMRDHLVQDGSRLDDPGNSCLRVAGLLKPGLSPAQAEGSMYGTIKDSNTRRTPEAAIEKVSLVPRRTYTPIVGEVLAVVVLVFAAFALLLLIACANLAGILVARGAARQREIAIRAALGASRGRLIRQLLTESVLLCMVAATLGMLLTQAGTGTVQQYLCTWAVQEGFSALPVKPDWHVFLFATMLALAAGFLLGFAPALEATRIDLAGRMRSGAGNHPSSRRRRMREVLVVGQVSASLVLLIVSGIFIRAAQRISRIDPGFDADHVIDIRADGSKRQLIERLKEDPWFVTASEVFRTPLSPHGLVRLPGRINDRDTRAWALGFNYVDSRYFEALGMPVRRGRNFTEPETRAQAPVVVVSEATARLLWPGDDPLGKTIEVIDPGLVGLDPHAVRFAAGKYGVIGVVQDVVSGLFSGRPDRTAIYLPAQPGDRRNGGLLVRSKDASPATITHIRKVCSEIDDTGPCEPITLREAGRRMRFPFVAASVVSSGVGALALIMTCIGLYGLVAFAVVQRTREIGIRMALGAAPLGMFRSIVAGSALRVSLGIALGIPLCVAFSKVAASVIYVVETFDLVAYVATPLFLMSVALVAACVPAHRVTRIDPMTALRQD
jgi:macrolide transport system ATP-binding/permease protein